MVTAVAQMEVVVHGRNVEVPEHFRIHVAERLAKVEKYDNKISRADVELNHEKNRRQTERCQHVEITCRTRGPVMRAEACADDFYKALELAVERLQRRFRHAADRRRVHHGRRTPTSVAAATARSDSESVSDGRDGVDAIDGVDGISSADWGHSDEGPGRIVRQKEHPAKPMNVDQALLEMELVGHDFFLFSDAATGLPSVVYRRHAYDYGLIRLTGD